MVGRTPATSGPGAGRTSRCIWSHHSTQTMNGNSRVLLAVNGPQHCTALSKGTAVKKEELELFPSPGANFAVSLKCVSLWKIG